MDTRGFQKLELRRNNPWITQTSLDLLQSWRANCDLQFLLYISVPTDLDPSDVARVTDYVIAYAYKGNLTLAEEKKHCQRNCSGTNEAGKFLSQRHSKHNPLTVIHGVEHFLHCRVRALTNIFC